MCSPVRDLTYLCDAGDGCSSEARLDAAAGNEHQPHGNAQEEQAGAGQDMGLASAHNVAYDTAHRGEQRRHDGVGHDLVGWSGGRQGFGVLA